MQENQWLTAHTRNLKNVRVAITGPTGGLGEETCRYLTSLGATLVLLDRNEKRSTALQQRLRAEFPQVDLERIPLDLADMGSVKRACEALKTNPPDILIHNAGAYSIPRHTCESGFDNVFQINCASPYYLTQELLPLLRERRGHVVVVSSIAHNYAKTNPADVDFATRHRASLVYGNAKRRLTFALQELFLGEQEATLSVVHPGIAFTGITAHYPKWLFALIKHPMKLIFMKPKKACLSIINGVFESTGYHEWIGPRVFDIWGLPRRRALHTCSREESSKIAAQLLEWYKKAR